MFIPYFGGGVGYGDNKDFGTMILFNLDAGFMFIPIESLIIDAAYRYNYNTGNSDNDENFIDDGSVFTLNLSYRF